MYRYDLIYDMRENGFDEAVEMINRLCKLNNEDRIAIFNESDIATILNSHHLRDVNGLIRQWEDGQINIGDIVIEQNRVFVVCRKTENCYYGFNEEGRFVCGSKTDCKLLSHDGAKAFKEIISLVHDYAERVNEF